MVIWFFVLPCLSAGSLAIPGDIWAFAFDPSGKYLAVAKDDTDGNVLISVYSLDTLKVAAPPIPLDDRPDALRFNHDGTLLAASSTDMARVFRWQTGKKIMPTVVPTDRSITSTGSGTSVDFSGDGRWMSMFIDDKITLIDLSTGKRRGAGTVPADDNDAILTRFSGDSKWLVSISVSSVVSLIDVSTGKLVASATLLDLLPDARSEHESLRDQCKRILTALPMVARELPARWQQIVDHWSGERPHTAAQTIWSLMSVWIDTLELDTGATAPTSATAIRFSPDGSLYANLTASVVEAVATDTGKPTGFHCSDTGLLKFSPDNAWALQFPVPHKAIDAEDADEQTANRKFEPQVWNVLSRKREAVLPAVRCTSGRFGPSAWSADGRCVAYITPERGLNVWLRDP